jgi:hypothetical protein
VDTPGYAKTQQYGQPFGGAPDDENWAGKGFTVVPAPETEHVVDRS